MQPQWHSASTDHCNYLNDVAFNQGDLGLGAAVGWVVAVIIFAISQVQIRLGNLASER